MAGSCDLSNDISASTNGDIPVPAGEVVFFQEGLCACNCFVCLLVRQLLSHLVD